jgi:sugar phosphate isomerase/epimerase
MSGIEYPKMHLVIDNCFAVKRWVRPRDWMKVVKEIGGISLIQASTDNEIDPIHNSKEYQDEWISEVQQYERKYGFNVVSFYSGYAQYRTVGIASHLRSKRDVMIKKYFEPTVDIAQKLGAQVGNTLAAYSEAVLNDPSQFAKTEKDVEESLVRMTKYAHEKGVIFGYEQMYTPTQGMWTIDGCVECIKRVSSRSKAPMYITIDTAHQAGQHLFIKPTVEEIEAMIDSVSSRISYLPTEIQNRIAQKQNAMQIYEALEKYKYWFSKPEDSDIYQWLSHLGCYSPIVHLQQTDGSHSSHKPFTSQYNSNGIIRPKDVFAAIKTSYDSAQRDDMPPRVKNIYLAFELFFGVTDSKDKIIREMRESVAFWRKDLPRDGMFLNELV